MIVATTVMPRDLFRVTVDEYNYSNLLSKSDAIQIPDHIALSDDEIADSLPGHVRIQDQVRIWAINTGSPAANEYENYMSPNDGLLFWKVERHRAHNEKRYVGVGEIEEKFTLDEETAEELFQTRTARLGFTVGSFSRIDKTPEDVEPILGYAQHPQRTQRVKPNRYTSVESALERLRQ